MAESKTAPAARERSIPILPLVVGLVIVLGAGGLWWLDRQSRVPPPKPVLTPEARAYIKNLPLSEVDMKANESYLSQRVVEITGKIGNTGERTLKLVEINCIFMDPYGQVVLRERVPIVSRKIGGLAPGEIKAFRLAFDNIPDSWNQGLPQLVIAQIVFAS